MTDTPDNPDTPDTPPGRSADGPHDTPPVLDEIIANKRVEIERRKSEVPFSELESIVAQADVPRNFFRAVTRKNSNETAVIAEVKRQSPSAGLIRPEYEGDGFKPEIIARGYADAGAAAISCLTDEKFFGGHLSYIQKIRESVGIPVIRKDFIIDPWQLWESRAAGADAVLLIAEALTEAMIVDLLILAHRLGLTVLLEVHSMENLLRVRHHIGFPHPSYCLLGINNRDLTTMTTDIQHSLRLADMVEDTSILVSESGITTPDDLAKLRDVGINIVLVGEHLMRQPDPGLALQTLKG